MPSTNWPAALPTLLEGLRDDLLNLLADLEAGLTSWTRISNLSAGRPSASLGRGPVQSSRTSPPARCPQPLLRPYRVVLAGRPDAGKSSLFNTSPGTPSAIVSPHAGTTRDYLIGSASRLGDIIVELVRNRRDWQRRKLNESSRPRSWAECSSGKRMRCCSCVEAGEGLTQQDQHVLAQARNSIRFCRCHEVRPGSAASRFSSDHHMRMVKV